MKRISLLVLLLSMAIIAPVNAQVGNFLKNVKNNVVKDLLSDKSESSKAEQAPDPTCACSDAVIGLDLGKYNLMYSEISLEMSDDGRMLVTSRIGNEYYIVKDGVSQGPIKEGDPRLADFGIVSEKEGNSSALMLKYKKYISLSGDKYVINFMGKTYGTYATINEFAVSKSGDKFAALVTKNMAVTESQGKTMDERMKNAKTDAEKMALAMEMAQQMQDNVMQAGAEGFSPEYISNIPGMSLEFGSALGGQLTAKAKYDDILLLFPTKIAGLNGKTLFTLSSSEGTGGQIFVNSGNTVYAWYNYGTLKISDGRTMSDLFSPYLVSEEGKVYLAYMYYSPKRNAIMLCKIPF